MLVSWTSHVHPMSLSCASHLPPVALSWDPHEPTVSNSPLLLFLLHSRVIGWGAPEDWGRFFFRSMGSRIVIVAHAFF